MEASIHMGSRVCLLALLLSALAPALVHASGYKNAFRSPTPPPPGQEQQAQPPNSLDVYEFNGVMSLGDSIRVSVFDTQHRKNVWLKQGEEGDHGLSFTDYDSRSDTITLRQKGIAKKLSLKQIEIQELRIAQATPPPANATSPQAAAPSPPRVETDEEARERIRKVAEEIRRRRAERRRRLEERAQGN